MNQPNRSIWVQNIRKDGKLTVLYVFPINGTRLKKIISIDQLRAESANGYDIKSLYLNLASLQLPKQ